MQKTGCIYSHRAFIFNFVNFLTTWIEEGSLQLNINKTKEMCCANNSCTLSKPLLLNGEEVELVGTFNLLNPW